MIIPTIVEKNYEGHQIYDIYSRLLKDRIIFLSGEINDEVSSLVISELLYLDSITNDDINNAKIYQTRESEKFFSTFLHRKSLKMRELAKRVYWNYEIPTFHYYY